MTQPPIEVPGKLYVGFWDLSLRNFPFGNIRHERLEPKDAKKVIDEARSNRRLRCGCHDDLLAPSNDPPLAQYKELCLALSATHGIALDVREFLSELDGWTTIFPLGCVQLQQEDQMLIVDCSFTMEWKDPVNFSGKGMIFTAESVAFHLFQPDSAGMRAKADRRNLPLELTEGFDALAGERVGKRTLKAHTVTTKPVDSPSADELVALRETLRLSRAAFAGYLRTNVRTLENWEQGRAKPNAQAAVLIRMVQRFPDTVKRLAVI